MYIFVNIYSLQAARRECMLRGIVGMHDPLRPGVADAMRRIKQSGARVMMITGKAHTHVQ